MQLEVMVFWQDDTTSLNAPRASKESPLQGNYPDTDQCHGWTHPLGVRRRSHSGDHLIGVGVSMM
jgi:hypothetical protein